MTATRRAPALVWFQQDLRLSDNPALAAALERGSPVVPVFILAPEEEGAWPPGAAAKWWLGHSLADLITSLEQRGSRLIIRRGPTAEALGFPIAETGAAAVFWNRRYEPAVATRDVGLKAKLHEWGLVAEGFNGSLLFEPSAIRNQRGDPFRVFSAFWRACLTHSVTPTAKGTPKRFPSPEKWPWSLDLADLTLEPKVDWAAGFREVWRPGESGARRRLECFLEEALNGYPVNRDRPDAAGTSRLSPHLHFGEISPRQVWGAVLERLDGHAEACQAYLRQIGWREFAYYLLHYFPESCSQPLRPEFAGFPWRSIPVCSRHGSGAGPAILW